MLTHIPTHLIGGPLGAGKTSLIRDLLAQKPAHERWAVLLNEFGQIGLDAALLSTDADGVALGEVAGGCLCCVNGVPFQVGLGRLLRKAKPDRLLIEPSGLGHPLQLLAQLGEAPWPGCWPCSRRCWCWMPPPWPPARRCPIASRRLWPVPACCC